MAKMIHLIQHDQVQQLELIIAEHRLPPQWLQFPSMISSASSLHIATDQTLRDLYSNTRGSVTSPRKIYFRRVNQSEFFSWLFRNLESFFSYRLIILNWNLVVRFEYFLPIQ